MNIMDAWKKGTYINSIGIFFISVCFIFIHFNSRAAQTQLTYLVVVLPFFFVVPLKKIVFKTEVNFIVLVILIFLSSLISFRDEISSPSFRSHWIYLLSVGTLIVLSQTNITKRHLVILLISASSMVFYDAVLEMSNNSFRGWNTHGKPIFYGNIALTTGLISLVFFMSKDNSKLMRFLLLFSTAAGLVGSIWSQTRGGWLFLGGFSLVFIYSYLIKNRNTSYLKSILFVLMFMILLLPFQEKVSSRLDVAYNNIENYIKHDNPNTSVGLRFELWKVSLHQFYDNPFTGSARSGFMAKKNELIAEGKTTPVAEGFEHAHSDIFWTLGAKGLLGIITLYGLYIYLFHFYYSNRNIKEARVYALSGLILVCSYVVYGLSESFFSMKLGIGYFIILNLILIRLINQERREDPFTLPKIA